MPDLNNTLKMTRCPRGPSQIVLATKLNRIEHQLPLDIFTSFAFLDIIMARERSIVNSCTVSTVILEALYVTN